MRVLKSVELVEMMERGSVKDADVLRLTQAIDRNGGISQAEANCLLALHKDCPVQAPAWKDFLVGVLTEHIVDHAEPEGYITAAKAKWLVSGISRDGRVETRAELDLLVSVIERARWVPASLVAFALAQVREAVIRGDGPLRTGEPATRGAIREREVGLVRALLCAFSDNGRIPITRTEAEILFDINDEIVPSLGCEAWTDLFVKASANLILAASGYSVPDRATALRAGDFSKRGFDGLPASLSASVEASLRPIRTAYGEQSQEERSLARLERQRIEIVTGEDICNGEAGWLAVRFLSDSVLSPTEEALVGYFRRERLIGGPLLAIAGERNGRAA
jgi:hypothetical protein